MKKLIVLFLMLAGTCAGTIASAQSFSRELPEKYRRHTPADVCNIRSSYAGHLKEKITEKEMRQVRTVIIRGDINGEDIAVLRKLCSRIACYDANGRSVDNYVDLDLSGARILSGGAYYCNYRSTRNEIGESMFASCSALRSIVLPEWTTYIHKKAFSSCNHLEDVMMPRGVRGIDDEAFSNCSNLRVVDLPEGIEHIGKRAFYHCTNLPGVSLPHTLRVIDDEAFSNCPFRAIRLPEGLTTLGSNAFTLSKLTEIELPASTHLSGSPGRISTLTAIYVAEGSDSYSSRDGVLYNKNGTTLVCYPMGRTGTLTVPAGVTRIGKNAFYGSRVSSVILPESIEEIGNSAFANCTAITSLALPEGISLVSESTFEGCTRLQQISLPGSLTAIGNKAFHNCESLCNIDLPAGLKSIGREAFRNCKSIDHVTVPAGVTTLAYKVFNECHALTRISLSEGLTTIEESALDNCNLAELVVPSTVSTIGKKMVEKNRNLQRIEVRAICPPELKSDSEKKVPLYVPQASLERYKNANNWKNYKTILPLSR